MYVFVHIKVKDQNAWKAFLIKRIIYGNYHMWWHQWWFIMLRVKMYIMTTTMLIFTTIYLTIVAQETTTDSFSDDLHIISREEWGARPPKSPLDNLTIKPVPYVIVHHSTGSSCKTRAACQLKVKGIQNYHMDNKQWFDIGYNFLVGEDGNVYEGRGWGTKGAHSIPFNNKSIGICIIGDYSYRTPNAKAVEAISKLIAYGVDNDEIRSNYKLLGHRQTWATSCPGDDLYAMIQSWPNWAKNAK